MSLQSFFTTIANGIYNGISWLYSNTIGALMGDFQGLALSSAESFALQLVGGFLSFFAYIANSFVSLLSGFTGWIASIGIAMGIFGVPVAMLLLVAIAGGAIKGIRVLVNLL